jgi:hypothetical protein
MRDPCAGLFTLALLADVRRGRARGIAGKDAGMNDDRANYYKALLIFLILALLFAALMAALQPL